MKTLTIGLLTLAFIVSALFLLLPWSSAADKPKLAAQDELLSKENVDWLRKGEGKLTEVDLIQRFGPFDEMRSPGMAVADYALVWRNRTVIRIKFVKDEVVDFSGSFSERLPDKKVTPEGFKKIKLGHSLTDVEQFLGTSRDEKKEWQYWGQHQTLLVYIKSGKTAGNARAQNTPGGWD
jgi:hypothetical protein